MRDAIVSLAGVVALLTGVLVVAGCSGSRPATDASATVAEKSRTSIESFRPDGNSRPVGNGFPTGYQVYGRSVVPEKIPTSRYDLLHTDLRLQLDFPSRSVDGIATHELVVLRDSTKTLPFHALGMTVRGVSLGAAGESGPAGWDVLPSEIEVRSSGWLYAGDTVTVEIAYTATPHRVGARRGMHFVDPDGTDPSRPTQIWTLGQPQDNRIWFPTWDYPNDRMTFEIEVVVPDSLQTVVSGKLVESEDLGDGSRADTWVLDVPQPAYLVAVAAGDFAVMKDEYISPVGKRTVLEYYAEPRFSGMLEETFGFSPDVMEVVERKSATPFPFSNLKQTAVHDFTAGGMENATAILYDHRIQHDERAHLDYTGRDIIIHEIAHQWFGDYVTCRSWAHLALNEGFANFFEQVYLEEAVGDEEAQEHRIADREGYLEEAARFRRPIYWTEYEDPNVLFDSHAYEKAELVLNALRFEIGDEAFWSGIRYYLGSSDGFVEIDDLKEAMERATRRPLTRFFDQWFYEPGHPELVVNHGFDEDFGLHEVEVHQVQDPTRFPIYHLEAIVELNYESGSVYKERVRMTTADTTYRFGVAGRISFVRFDEGDHLLADILESKPLEQWQAQALDDDEMASRLDAVRSLSEMEPSAEIAGTLMEVAENDAYDLVRQAALQALHAYRLLSEVVRLGRRAAAGDESPRCRRAAIQLLAHTGDPSAIGVVRRALEDESYYVVAEAVSALAALVPDSYMETIRPVLGLRSWESIVELTILDVISENPTTDALAYVQGQLDPANPARLRMAALEALASFAQLGGKWKERVRSVLEGIGADHDNAIAGEVARYLKTL